MGAVYNISRSDVFSLIKNTDQRGGIIITGLDGSGKTTEIKNHIGNFKYIKTDQVTSELYYSKENGEFTKKFLDQYELYDRHPIIDYPVYHYASLIESGDATEADFIKFLNDNVKYSEESYNFIIYLNDKFVNKTTQNKWIAILRPYILNLYQVAAKWFADNTECLVYLVKD